MLKRMWNAATSGSVWDTHNKETADAYLNALNQVTGMATQSNMSTAMNTQAQLLQDMESLYRSARDRKISLTTSGASVPGINGKVSPESVSKTVQLYEYDKTGKPTGKVYNVPSQLVDQTLEVLNLQRGETQWGIYK